jgi:hypothetical protein
MEDVASEQFIALEIAPLDISLGSLYPDAVWSINALLLLIPIE